MPSSATIRVRLAPAKIQISTHEWVHMPIALLDSLILDRTAKRSLQRQLGLELKRLIRRGALPAGGPVRSSRALAEDLRVSRNTVTGAYDRLVGEGYLDARPRSGLFVSASLASMPRVRNQRRAIRPPSDPDERRRRSASRGRFVRVNRTFGCFR